MTGSVEWEPTQYKPSEIHDLRGAKQGPKGYKERCKRKLEEMEELHQQDQESAAARMEEDGSPGAGAEAMQEDGQQEEEARGQKRRKVDTVKHVPVSGRVWKLQAKRSGAVMKPQLKVAWEKRMANKASRQSFLDNKKAAVDAAKEKRRAAAQQRKAAAERKKANKAKSEVVQKITNSATVKKMMKNKKQKKLLRTADTN